MCYGTKNCECSYLVYTVPVYSALEFNFLLLISMRIYFADCCTMGFFNKNKSSEEMQNWYKDRYLNVALQRNFLLFFSLFISLSLLFCLFFVKRLQEKSISDPYLIEYDKNTGYMTVVEAKSKKEYTAQQAVKENMVLQYIGKREAPSLVTLEEDMNYVRTTTNAKIYQLYLNDVGENIKKLRSAGVNARYEIKIKSLQYLAANRLVISAVKKTIVDGKETAEMDYQITIAFNFVDIEMPIEDMRVNPLGFQVSYYQATEVKTFKGVVVDYENKKNKNSNDNKK